MLSHRSCTVSDVDILGKSQNPEGSNPDVQEFMAAAVVLEHMVRREWLKPYWRLWSFPAPSPYDCGAPCCSV